MAEAERVKRRVEGVKVRLVGKGLFMLGLAGQGEKCKLIPSIRVNLWLKW